MRSAASVSGKGGQDAMLVLEAAAASSFCVSLVLSLEVEVGSEATSCLYDSPSTVL